MLRILEFTVLPVMWGGVLLAALSMHDMEKFSQHFVCGPWGCGPPTNALLAIHIGWVAALWPPLFYLPWRLQLSRKTVKTIVLSLTAIGLTGLLAIIAWQWIIWLPNTSDWARSCIWQRCGFAIVTAGDWPLMQLLAGGLLLGTWLPLMSYGGCGHSDDVPMTDEASVITDCRQR